MCGCKKTPKKKRITRTKRIIKKLWDDTQNPKQKIKKI